MCVKLEWHWKKSIEQCIQYSVEKPLFAMTASRRFLYEDTNLSHCPGAVLAHSFKQTVFKCWGFRGAAGESSVASTNVLLSSSRVIDRVIPTPLFSFSWTSCESPLQYVLDCCPVGGSTRISSSLSWWMATDSSQEYPDVQLHSCFLRQFRFCRYHEKKKQPLYHNASISELHCRYGTYRVMQNHFSSKHGA